VAHAPAPAPTPAAAALPRAPSQSSTTPSTAPALTKTSSLRSPNASTYDKQVSYKYLPLELASASPVKNSIAKNILFQSLGHGLMVIKYGKV
jgi:hypothetical protein